MALDYTNDTETSLLPYNANEFERCMEGTTSRISDVPVPVRSMWNPQTCPVALLPWLAWAFRVNEWDSSWPEATQRAVIAMSASVHRIKGTVASIKTALAAAGFPGATIVEGAGAWYLDGSRMLNGEDYFGDPTKWAWYRVQLAQPIANSQVGQVKRILADTAPARCYLEALDFSEAAFLLDGSVLLNGSYNLGLAQ
jgi:phage tail P2-like protein